MSKPSSQDRPVPVSKERNRVRKVILATTPALGLAGIASGGGDGGGDCTPSNATELTRRHDPIVSEDVRPL